MPVPLAPYPTPPAPHTPPANGGQRQLVCSGCRNLLLYPVGATSVCCAVCNAVTTVPPPGTEMAQLVCGGCHTLLMYIRGATSVQCSCCHTVNLALEGMSYGNFMNGPSRTGTYQKVFFSQLQVLDEFLTITSFGMYMYGDSKSNSTCQLWELQNATNVSVWSTVSEMRSLQFCDISWGLNKHS